MGGAWILLRVPYQRQLSSSASHPLKPFSTSSSHPWPEWAGLIKSLEPQNHVSLPSTHSFRVYEQKHLSSDFIRSASALISFSRHNPQLLGMLSRRNIEVVVTNGMPFLFRGALGTARRMRSFLALTGGNAVEADKPNTLDLMKYILSYASNPALPSSRTNINSRELIDSSVRNLLQEMAAFNSGTPSLDESVEDQTHFHDRIRQTSRIHKPDILMKRGDWKCPKCCFVNFSRNNQCFQCEEHKPKNMSSTTGEYVSEIVMPLSRGESTSVVSTTTTPLERHQSTTSKGIASGPVGAGSSNVDNRVNRSLDKNLGHSSATSQNRENGITSGENSEAVFPIPKDGASEASSISDSGEGNKFQISDNSKNPDNVKNKNKEDEDNSGKWLQRMDNLHSVRDLSSSVSGEDFHEIVPARKGENTLVVGKKNHRSSQSPTYKRNMATEQASSSKYLPFVPSPLGYFARTEPQHPKGSISPANSVDNVPTSPQEMQRYAGMDNSRINQDGAGAIKRTKNDQISWEGNIISINNTTYIPPSHPWPEWSRLIDSLQPQEQGDHAILPEDSFLVYEEKELSTEFIRSASAFLAFSHHNPQLLRMLSRRDIEVVVTNGMPFLFKGALETARRMSSFLAVSGGNAIEADKANTVDLMKYILSYASNPAIPSSQTNIYSRELIDSSVRNLLQEMAVLNSGTPRLHKPNIVMKRGDWKCPKCCFVNFARNNQCLQCEEHMPQNMSSTKGIASGPVGTGLSNVDDLIDKILNHSSTTSQNRGKGITSGENPEVALPITKGGASEVSSISDSGEANKFQISDNSKNLDNVNNKNKEQEDKSSRRLQRMADLHSVKDLSSSASDENTYDIMSARKGENTLVVGKKKKRSSSSPIHKRNMVTEQASPSKYVPFVPFSPGYFPRTEPQNPEGSIASANSADNVLASPQGVESYDGMDNSRIKQDGAGAIELTEKSQIPGNISDLNMDSGWTKKSLEGSAAIEPEPLDMSEESKAERWLQLLFPIKDISNRRQIRDRDFPSKMPMRKGVKRFAPIKDVSKRSRPDRDFPSERPMREGVNRFDVSKRRSSSSQRRSNHKDERYDRFRKDYKSGYTR